MPSTETSSGATIVWLRRDLRVADNPALVEAATHGGPVIPVFILDEVIEDGHGAAAKWRLGESLKSLSGSLERIGSRLILRRGKALTELRKLVAESSATRLVWSRQYEPKTIERDRDIKAALTNDGTNVASVNASLLFEPWDVSTKTGGLYRVYTPFWRSVRDRDVRTPLATPKLPVPSQWPVSDALEDWRLGRAMNRGAAVIGQHAIIGEDAAQERLQVFIAEKITRYRTERDFPSAHAVSGLSENLTYGEISPHQVWAAGHAAMQSLSGEYTSQAEHFLKELVWREFAYHLLYHTPHIMDRNWREEWDSFPWRGESDDAERWRRGQTGIEMVDAAMREMYVTGTMHNRTRMLVASYLTKHLLTHWKIGEAWFRDCLIDWDPAANAMGWQWTAGSGPDAAPYFRIYNPDTQAEKFDRDRQYRNRFIAEGRRSPHADALSFFDAIPRCWGMRPDAPYPAPVAPLATGRARALAAYESRKTKETAERLSAS